MGLLRNKRIIGWQEWVVLNGLGLPPLQAKIDTGARTSALHAFSVRAFNRRGGKWVRFSVHPLREDPSRVISCEAPVIDRRWVTDSGGHKEMRYVIASQIGLAEAIWPIELTLTNRDTMRFRLLLGRTALGRRFLVHPSAIYLCGGTARQHPFSALPTTDNLPSL